MVCNRTTKQHHQNRCSGFFRLFRCSWVFRIVPVFQCSSVPVFRCSGVFRGVPGCSGVFRCSGVPLFLVLVHALSTRSGNETQQRNIVTVFIPALCPQNKEVVKEGTIAEKRRLPSFVTFVLFLLLFFLICSLYNLVLLLGSPRPVKKAR